MTSSLIQKPELQAVHALESVKHAEQLQSKFVHSLQIGFPELLSFKYPVGQSA